MRTLQYFWNNSKKDFALKKMKNYPQKLLRNTHIYFSSLLAWAAQTAQTEEFMVQNVAYRPTVYKTGVWSGRSTEFIYWNYDARRHNWYMFEVNDFLCAIKTWKNQQNDYI